LARDLQHLLGYDEWRNFTKVIEKAKSACEISGHKIADHFVEVNKMVSLGSGSQREVDDLMLTRYSRYLIAQNGDPKKTRNCFCSDLLCNPNTTSDVKSKLAISISFSVI